MNGDRERIVRLITVLLPYAKLYVVESYNLKNNEMLPTPGIDLAIDAGEQIPQEHLIQIKNILQALSLSQPITIIDLYSLPVEKRVDILKDAIAWKN